MEGCVEPQHSKVRSNYVTDLIGDLDELALGEVAVFVFGVSVVLEHLQDDFTPS